MVWALAATVVAVGAARLSRTEALRLLGLPDPGALTTIGLPAVMAFGETAAVVMVGSLLLATVLVPPQRSGVLDVDGHLAIRTAGRAAAVWSVCAAVLVVLSLSDTSGQPLAEVFAEPARFIGAAGQIDVTRAWAWTAVLGIVVALGCRLVLRHQWTPVLLLLAIAALMPRAVSGHSAAGGSHDLATSSLALHLVAASLWAGGLAALVLHARRRGRYLDVAVRRFSVLAPAAFAVLALSGLVNAAVRVPFSTLFASTYGLLLLAKAAALLLVGVLGWRQRSHAVHSLSAEPGDRSAFVRLAVTETVILAVTVGLAVALSRTPPPAPQSRREPSVLEETLGYGLSGPPSILRLISEWRFDLLFGTAAIVLALCYLLAARRLARTGNRWPIARTICWVSGCMLMLLATSSGLGRYAPAVFSMHMVAVATLGVLAPLCLAAGAPLSLTRATLGPPDASAVPGVRHWLRAASRSAPVRALTNPAVVWVLFSGGYFVFYIADVYGGVAGSHVWHVLANAYFLLTGYLLFWVGLGVDEVGNRPAERLRNSILVFTALGAFLVVALVLSSTDTTIAADYYAGLRRGWWTDLAADQQRGSVIALILGLIAVVATGAQHAPKRQNALPRRRPWARLSQVAADSLNAGRRPGL